MLYVCHHVRATSGDGAADQGSRLHPALQGKGTRFWFQEGPWKSQPVPQGADLLTHEDDGWAERRMFHREDFVKVEIAG